MRYTSTSLYRYAGGKNKMKDEIVKIIREVCPNLTHIMSPFMGGGCIEIFLASQGVKVQAYDLFQPLADFWETLTTEGGKRIGEEVAKHYPLKDREHYKSFLPLLESDDKFTRAWAFYICIKGAFSGDLGHTSEASRKNLNLAGIHRLIGFYNPNLSFSFGDCFETIPKHQNDFIYLDPPYYKTTSYYYGIDGSTHEGFNHDKLAEVLKQHKGGFVMSYDNTDYLKELYKDWTEFRYLEFDYQMAGDVSRRGKKTELIVIKYPEKKMDSQVNALESILFN
jgi:DNA adenine methylase